MKRIKEYLNKSGVFYVATVDGDQAKVRPFGGVFEFDGGLYIVSDKQKDVVKQMVANPKIEIAAVGERGSWIRITAKAVIDDRKEVKQAVLDQSPFLQKIHTVDDPNFACIRLTDGFAKIMQTEDIEEITL